MSFDRVWTGDEEVFVPDAVGVRDDGRPVNPVQPGDVVSFDVEPSHPLFVTPGAAKKSAPKKRTAKKESPAPESVAVVDDPAEPTELTEES